MQCERGSEWRRWDLHIHTPDTTKNDQYEGTTSDEKWNKFYEDINSYIGDGANENKNIVTIGITDYLSIDNYRKVLADRKLSDIIELILPNIEMRMQPIAADSPINIHFIFDPTVADELNNRFFSQLDFRYGETVFHATKDDLIRLGKTINSELDEVRAYKKGVNSFVPTFDALKQVFEKDMQLRKHVIIGVSNSTGDGVSGAVNHCDYICPETGEPQLVAARQAIYQFCDCIFSATPSDIDYFLGKGTDNLDIVTKKCGSLKPCIKGCDAHKNDKIFEPNLNRYCWIKADPTFNGLQQLVYEPYERVRIQQIKPEEKPDYYVINSVYIDDKNFQPEPIVFNDKLTCIIGGKSTGKSLLLHNLALTIDSEQAIKKCEKAHTNIKAIPSIKVKWKDGFENTISDSPEKKRKIIYIPQTYLNRLSDENEETSEIDKIIEDIVLLNEDANKAFSERLTWFSSYKPSLDKKIYDIIAIHKQVIEVEDERKELGTDVGIKREIKKIRDKKDKLSKEASLSDTDVSSYDDASTSIRKLNYKIEKLSQDYQYIESIDSVLTGNDFLFDLSEKINKEFAAKIEMIHKVADESWLRERMTLLSMIQVDIDSFKERRKGHEAIVNSLKDKIESNDAIKELTESIQSEQEKLDTHVSLTAQLTGLNGKLNNALDEVVQSCGFYKEKHEMFACSINDNENLKKDDLEFTVTIPFRRDAFCEKIKIMTDQRSLKRIIDLDVLSEDFYTSENIKMFIKSILKNTVILKKGFDIESALREVLADWYNTVYTVKMDGDTIQEMSPGKKALVLLKLLINLAESKCPILVDQPEDDLDNRSIYNDLISFLKEKKKERQIIVVTHNANIVLGGDAEEIIVANQFGKSSPNKQYKFEYRSGSIENNNPKYNNDGVIDRGILNSRGIQHHICEILEGGEKAFYLRKNKYHFETGKR